MKKLVALALGTVMAVSMTAGVSAATVESKDDLKNATIGVQLGTTGDIEASEYEADGATVKRYSKGSEAIHQGKTASSGIKSDTALCCREDGSYSFHNPAL